MDESRFSVIELKFALLRCFTSRSEHRINVLGRPLTPGGLEGVLGTRLEPPERALAAKALRDLEGAGLVRANYRDTVDPENWLEITEAGTAALARGALDELDAALASIDPHLVEMRHGAWAAIHSAEPDSIRQAAHSARELFTQILDKEAHGIQGRRKQIKAVMRLHLGRVSDTALAIIETQAAAAEALQNSLHAVAHARESVANLRGKVSTIVREIEVALIHLLGVGV
jgi:hypothetical protein